MQRKLSGSIVFAMVVTSCAVLAATKEPPAQHGSDKPQGALRLASRLANYGPFEKAAWTHLPSIGVKYVFMSVPAADQVDAAQRRLSQHHLTALVLRGEADLSKDAGIDVLAGQLATCEKMGVKYMFLSVKGHWPDKEVIYERLRRAGDAAKKHGVIIALETHPELGTNGDVHLQTMKAIHHPNVRVNFDTGNITYYNKGADAARELEKIVDYVATVEIKDHNGQFETWNFPALGKGVVKIPRVLQILKEHHYAGPITIEIEGVKDVKRDEEQTKADIAESVRYLRGLAQFD